jgi:hypothetical protein
MPRPIPDAIAATARPYLRQVVDLCAGSERSPGDYVLLLGKYSAEETFLFPRSSAVEILDRAKTAARRRKCERLIALPCGPHDLLVMVCAGEHVEGHTMRVPTVVRKEAPPLTETPPCSCNCGQAAEIEFRGLYYTRACFQRTVDELRAMGVPIEQSDKGLRLAPSTRVSFRLDDPEPKR